MTQGFDERFERDLDDAVAELKRSREPSAKLRDRSWSALQAVAVREAKRNRVARSRRWTTWTVLAALLLAVLSFGLRLREQPVEPALRGPSPVALTPEASEARDEPAPKAPSRRRKLPPPFRTLASGARYETSGGAKLDVIEDTQREGVLFLGAGAVDVSVPPLAPDQRLRVRTPGVTVSVHGTEFTVERRPGLSEVRVREGRVKVEIRGVRQPPVFLGPGGSVEIEDGELRLARLRSSLRRMADETDFAGYLEAATDYLELAPPSAETDSIRLRRAGALAQMGRRAEAVAALENAALTLSSSLGRENALARLAMLSDSPLEVWIRLLVDHPTGQHRAVAIERITETGCPRSMDRDQLKRLEAVESARVSEWVASCLPP